MLQKTPVYYIKSTYYKYVILVLYSDIDIERDQQEFVSYLILFQVSFIYPDVIQGLQRSLV